VNRSRSAAKIYATMTPRSLAKLWCKALARGDESDAAAILRATPRVRGSVRSIDFIREAARQHPDHIEDIVGLNLAAAPQKFEIVVRRLPATVDAARKIVAEADARRKAS
jgi:hypothetical protein